MLFEFIFGKGRPARPAVDDSFITVGSRQLPLVLVRNPRARRYLLRLREDGTARVTIPRGGSLAVAKDFIARHIPWLEKQLQRLQSQPRKTAVWKVGTEILLRGEIIRIEREAEAPGLEFHLQAATRGDRLKAELQTAPVTQSNGAAGTIRFGGESLRVPDTSADLRSAIEGHLRQLATRELPPRLLELAAQHGLKVNRVTVRNQRTRWGSCSRRGTISLNWQLIQTPPCVRDYICLHELMHLRQMNHSARYWQEVERVCPDYPAAERWLKQHSLGAIHSNLLNRDSFAQV